MLTSSPSLSKIFLKNKLTTMYAVIVIVLYCVYFTPLTSTYYFGDETSYFRSDFTLPNLVPHFFSTAMDNGRPISLLFYGVMTQLVLEHTHGLFIVRWISFLIVSGVSCICFWLMRHSIEEKKALLIILFLWSLPVIQPFYAYAMLPPYMVGALFSLGAYWIVFIKNTRRSLPSWSSSLLVLVFHLLSWLTFQASPFFSFGFICITLFLTPAQKWYIIRRRAIYFFVSFVCAFLVYVVGYKAVLMQSAVSPANQLATRVFSSEFYTHISLLANPYNYWTAFEWWNYFLPIKPLPELVIRAMGILSMMSWLALLTFSFYLDKSRMLKKILWQKYGAVALFTSLSFLPIAADSFSGRQHVFMSATVVIILTGIYALHRIVSIFSLTKKFFYQIAVVGVLFSLLAAQVQVYRSIVLPSVAFYTFVSEEIIRQSSPETTDIVIINVPQSCAFEPCRGFFDRQLGIADRPRPYFYWTMWQKITGDATALPITYMTSPTKIATSSAIVIDFRILSRSQLR